MQASNTNRFFFAPRYRYLLLPALLLLLLPGLLKTYLLMPFPGSQRLDSLELVYYLLPWILPLRVIGLILMLPLVVNMLIHGRIWKKVGAALLCLLCGGLYWLTEIKFNAARMFEEPATVAFVKASECGLDPKTLVIGVERNDIAKAYPVDYLAYHHKVFDIVSGQPALVTYCTMCRTGAVFRPEADGHLLHFELIGANRYNAIFQDRETRTLWYQATGEAVVGPLKGKQLASFPWEQVTLEVWLRKYPRSLVLSADPSSRNGYKTMEGFGNRRAPTDEDGDGNWSERSWVVGVHLSNNEKAYPWGPLVRKRVINDTIDGLPLVIALEGDLISFHVWRWPLNTSPLNFSLGDDAGNLLETTDGSQWNWDGYCVEGPAKGIQLERVQASTMYWHAWQTFHRGTLRWNKKE